MRRKDREVTDFNEIISILDKSKVLHLSMISEGFPYSVPVNFGYIIEECKSEKKLSIYFHGAGEGKKISALKENPNVSFSAVANSEIVALSENKEPCSYSCLYESVIGFGKVEILEDSKEKTKGMDSIMLHNGYKLPEGIKIIAYKAMSLANTAVCKIAVNEITGKRHKRK